MKELLLCSFSLTEESNSSNRGAGSGTILCCDCRAGDLSGLKPEQQSEKVQTGTQQNEHCVTEKC